MKNFNNFFKNNLFILLIPVGVFLISAFFALFFFSRSVSQLKEVAQQRFYVSAKSIVSQFAEEYKSSTTTLNALQALFFVNEDVDRNLFYDFIEKSNFFEAHKGFSTFAYVERVVDQNKKLFIDKVRLDNSVDLNGYPNFEITPSGSRSEYWPIVYISPESDVSFLLGQDQKTERVRAENLGRARDSGEISLSEVVSLGQGGPGLLMATPLYFSSAIPSNIEDRQRLYSGGITSAFLIKEFFEPILPLVELKKKKANIDIRVRGGEVISLFSSEIPRDWSNNLFGEISMIESVNLGQAVITFIFNAPVKSQLSRQEAFEPFLIVLLFFIGAVILSALAAIVQKMRESSDLKKKYEFIRLLSHQLLTPLTSLRWQMEVQKVPRNYKKAHKIMYDSTLAMGSIVQRMLLYFEISRGGITESMNTVSKMSHLYKESLALMGDVYDISRLKLKGKKYLNKKVLINEKNMALALSYVIENALIYSLKKMPVIIDFSSTGKSVIIKIIDKGYGIPAEEQKRVFTEFFRASNASLGINYGSAVSLYMSKKIIEGHGGRINFESTEGQGSTFTIVLPLAKG